MERGKYSAVASRVEQHNNISTAPMEYFAVPQSLLLLMTTSEQGEEVEYFRNYHRAIRCKESRTYSNGRDQPGSVSKTKCRNVQQGTRGIEACKQTSHSTGTSRLLLCRSII